MRRTVWRQGPRQIPQDVSRSATHYPTHAHTPEVPEMPKAREVFSQRMRRARTDAGLSLASATYLLRDALPERITVSIETVRRLETGFTPEEAASPIIVAALAQIYGKPVEELSASAAHDVERILSVLSAANGGGGLRNPHSAWNGRDSEHGPRHLFAVPDLRPAIGA